MSSDKKAAFIYNNHLYFFSGPKYVIIALSPEQRVVRGPGDIKEDWTAFKHTGFSHIDCILPVHDALYPGEFYVFSGDKYIWMKLDGAEPINPVNSVQRSEVRSVSTNWSSLNKAGWNSVDAALLNIQKSGKSEKSPQEAFFWKNDHCINITYIPGEDDGQTTIVGPLKSEQMWSSFKSENIVSMSTVFKDVDPTKFWVFYDNRSVIQVKYDGKTGSGSDWVELGKADVVHYFPALKDAFYPVQ
ncbi:hypothetical protein M422DRAFT_49070 [Sphaerobolus stellatus SS14]|uniref:Unplaced genomic scaffold SPHSTscaffold_67, whole genome shotgun sequence n=1 Tax=Sphaerobolus stellatus (strain SS14) TaxID=990650 RepID=A0A0C9V106_SPHS4|nr:hypothetical protein M422DRAFT_49070 [Sphaerobolus stellatus SS14]